jgi:Flp pilus assembly protein TadG
MRCRNRYPNRQRKGGVLVLAALFMVVILGMVAFAVDFGYLAMARTELQRTADAAAIAGCWELMDNSPPGATADLTTEIALARQTASQYVTANTVCNGTVGVNTNSANDSGGDIVIGNLDNPSLASSFLTFSNPNEYNAVQVRVSKSASSNGVVPLFFGRVFGMAGQAVDAQATAALLNNIGGFRVPADGSNLEILPFALDQQTWDDMLNGGGDDAFKWDDATQSIVSGHDGVREINLYPQGTGSPGNRGTIDIGGSNNSTADIARQIVHGVNQSDLDHIGGELKLDSSGKLYLNGDTGISAGVKDELASIIGKPRVIPIFSTVAGPGNNATYTIVKFAGVRILDVKLTGAMSGKRVILQPAKIVTDGAIANTSGTTSYSIYSVPWLVR